MNKWHKISSMYPDYNEPVLCLLNNGKQIVLAPDECSKNWIVHNEEKSEDAHGLHGKSWNQQKRLKET